MADRFEADPDEVAQRLRTVRAKQATLWGRDIATEVPHQHIEGARCLCDACSDARPARQGRPASLIIRKRKRSKSASVSGELDEVGRRLVLKPRPLNLPRRTPGLNMRQILLLNKWGL
jgi:hypothetical protein